MTPSSSHSGPKRSNNHESCIEGGYHRRVTSPKADHADSKLEESETAFQSHKLDRQVTDHTVSATNHLSSGGPDRQGDGDDRLLAN
jgi:hypothetical protein